MTLRPRCRSALFVPAANARALEKSTSLGVDALIFDLEDAVLPGEKPAARERLRRHLAERARENGVGAPTPVIRINPLTSEWGTEDLLMARAAMPAAVLVPKVEEPDDLELVSGALADTDAPNSLALWAMIETPRGLLEAGRIAREGVRLRHPLTALVVGPNDIVAATGIRLSPGRLELLSWLSTVVLAAKAYGLLAIDGVCNDLADDEKLEAEARQAKGLGFDGKTLIHPAQVPPAHRGFAPTEDEIEAARAVVAAFARPEAAGLGVLSLGGRMVERLHLAGAERLLADSSTENESRSP